MNHDFTGVRCLLTHCREDGGPCRECRRCGWVGAREVSIPCGVVRTSKSLALHWESLVSTRLEILNVGAYRVVVRKPVPLPEETAYTMNVTGVRAFVTRLDV